METEVLKKVAEIEALTGKSLVAEISNVPFGNVVTAFRVIPFTNIVKMVKSVDLETLVTGLKIITPKQIAEIPVDALEAVLLSSNMPLVEKLQDHYGEDAIIEALNKISVFWVRALLAKDDLSFAISAVDNALYGKPDFDWSISDVVDL